MNDNSRLAYLMQILDCVAATQPIGVAAIRKAAGNEARRLAKESGFSSENFREAYNLRSIGVPAAQFWEAVQAAMDGEPASLRETVLTAPAYQGKVVGEAAERLHAVLSALGKGAGGPRHTPTFLLTWNPDKWRWPPAQLADALRRFHAGEQFIEEWSTGNTKRIRPGDQVVLMRLGTARRGVFASGTVVSETYEAPHWHEQRAARGDTASRVDVSIVEFVDPDGGDMLPLASLKTGIPGIRWTPQASGTEIPAEFVGAFELIWQRHLRGCPSPYPLRLVSNADELRASAATYADALGRGDLRAKFGAFHPGYWAYDGKAEVLAPAKWAALRGVTPERYAAYQELQRELGTHRGFDGGRARKHVSKLLGAEFGPAPNLVRALSLRLSGAFGTSVIDNRDLSDLVFVDLDKGTPTPLEQSFAAVCSGFADAVAACHLSYGERHLDFVRTFLASVVTKRFAILTGLSGSGKTQIALKFGEWLGPEQHLIVAVRPDWTGSEAIFGYEDALQPPIDGQPAWHVPEVLSFMLGAAGDGDRPYLLILDEMNLAHVERYFADVLSGIESGKPCLPNLTKTAGRWSPAPNGPAKLPFPSNLFVVGTVNVDETTYMFSPKVLDRANTLEFRVATADLPRDGAQLRSPTTCPPAAADEPATVLALARQSDWHIDNPAPFARAVAESLRSIHEVLSPHGFEFGHRVFSEALRFSALFHAAGEGETVATIDRIVMQKVLPRLHGSRRGLEPLLREMGDLTYHGERQESASTFDPETADASKAAMPISFAKIQRMTRRLRANQFASFAE